MVAKPVTLTVNLNAELGAVAIEIEGVPAKRMLSSDMWAVEMTRLDLPP
jgi:hypothetical protein